MAQSTKKSQQVGDINQTLGQYFSQEIRLTGGSIGFFLGVTNPRSGKAYINPKNSDIHDSLQREYVYVHEGLQVVFKGDHKAIAIGLGLVDSDTGLSRSVLSRLIDGH